MNSKNNLETRNQKRTFLCFVIGISIIFAIIVASVKVGSVNMSFQDVIRVLFGGGDSTENLVVWRIRLGRTAVAVGVGAILGFAGSLTQTVARNPLASPDLIGIPQAASLAVVVALVFSHRDEKTVVTSGSDALLTWAGIPGIAIIGSCLGAILVGFLAGFGKRSILRVVLIGIGVSSIFASITTWILSVTELDRAASARVWITGSINGRDWQHAWPALLVLFVAILLSKWITFQISALSLGDATAHILGHNVPLAQAGQLLTAVVLTAVAVSAAGPIGFIAFMSPQLARILAKTPTPPLGLSALFGALILATADFSTRSLLPWELPVGIITVFMGAPVLLYLIITNSRKATI